MINIIRDHIEKVLPDNWEKVDVFADITDTNYEISFFVFVNEKQYQCYQLNDEFSISEEKVNKAFEKIYSDLKEKGLINNKGFTFSFTKKKNGKPKTINEKYGMFDWLSEHL